MNYKFPKIEHLDDVLPAIKGSPEFAVMERGPITVVNYHVVKEETFPPIESAGGIAKDREEKSRLKAIRRECRGLIFDTKTGKIISRRYHKFFNLNERSETMVDRIDWNEPHLVLEKIDGSMITIENINGKFTAMTKMGATDVAQQAQEFIGENPQYIHLVNDSDLSHTFIFEWISRKSRIVVDYPTDSLILTGIRNKFTGTYFSNLELYDYSDKYNIPVVSLIGANLKNFDFMESLEDQEGIVIRFESGHMLKVKTPWYVLRHKSKDAILREKSVLEMIFNEELDDVIPFLEASDASKVLKFRDAIFKGLTDSSKNILTMYEKYRRMSNYDRKRFALEIGPVVNGHIRSMIFRLWDEPVDENVVFKLLFNLVKGNLSSIDKIESIRHFIGYQRWKHYNE